MKLSVVLEKKARFNIELPEEIAEKLFNKLVGNMIVDRIRHCRISPSENNVEPKEIITEDATSSPQNKDCPEKIAGPHKEASRITTVTEKEASTENKVDMVKDFGTSRARTRKLAMLKCSDCGEIIVAMVEEGQENIVCRKCSASNCIAELKPAKYICPNCGYTAVFNIKEGLETVKCKGCESEIDLFYHEKKDKYLSANLMK